MSCQVKTSQDTDRIHVPLVFLTDRQSDNDYNYPVCPLSMNVKFEEKGINISFLTTKMICQANQQEMDKNLEYLTLPEKNLFVICDVYLHVDTPRLTTCTYHCYLSQPNLFLP